MTIKKSELKELIREALREELSRPEALTEGKAVPEESVLANHVGEDPAFEEACNSRSADKILAVIDNKMNELNMHTKGAKLFRDTVLFKTKGKSILSQYEVNSILMYVSNCRLSSYGMKSPDSKRYKY